MIARKIVEIRANISDLLNCR